MSSAKSPATYMAALRFSGQPMIFRHCVATMPARTQIMSAAIHIRPKILCAALIRRAAVLRAIKKSRANRANVALDHAHINDEAKENAPSTRGANASREVETEMTSRLAKRYRVRGDNSVTERAPSATTIPLNPANTAAVSARLARMSSGCIASSCHLTPALSGRPPRLGACGRRTRPLERVVRSHGVCRCAAAHADHP